MIVCLLICRNNDNMIEDIKLTKIKIKTIYFVMLYYVH